jgi:hypothetical protein
MCHRVIFDYQGGPRTVSFKNPYAKLPVLLRNGQLKFLPWGRREFHQCPFPLGSSICLKEIKAGKFDTFFPKPVKLPIKAFLVSTQDGATRWFHLPQDKWLQGVILRNLDDMHVFIVSLMEHGFDEYLNWPRILVSGNKSLSRFL